MKITLISATVALFALSACDPATIITGQSYPPINPNAVQISFSASPNCANPLEIGLIPQVGSNKYAQDRAINEIKRIAASRGANLVLLDTTATSLLGDMLIDAVMYRCA